jgi:hypothetical protein
MTETNLDAALEYRRLGWSIIPMRLAEKKPAVRWKRYQSASAGESTVRRWFCPGSTHGIAVVFGQASGGLASRDFDSMTAYEDWKTNHPDLAASLPTVETRRGCHVYCRTEPDHVREIRARLGKPDGTGAINCLDGELRAGVGCYSVVPPSKHPSGAAYRWLNPLVELPILNLVESGFVILTDDTEKTEDHRGPQRNTEAIGGAGERECEWDTSREVPWNEDIERAIVETLPTRRGMRNDSVFELARTLKAVAQLADVPGKDLRPYVQFWHKLALPVIGTKPFEETWIDFLKGWPRVKFPKGRHPIAEALANAIAAELPEAAIVYEQEPLRLLVSLCRELQRAAGDSFFFLSCRTAARFLGVHFKTTNRWLFLLVEEEVLALVSRGTASTMRASRYRYIADL